jgi:hypothetical protein
MISEPPPKSNEIHGQSWREFYVDAIFMAVIVGVAMLVWKLFG